MVPESKGRLPPPNATLSVVKLLALASFMFMRPEERERLLKVLRWVATVFSGPIENWPLDFGRHLAEAVPTIEANQLAANWIARLAEQLEIIGRSL